jgi:hypothetical protein
MKNAKWWKFWRYESGAFGGVVMGSLLAIYCVFFLKLMCMLVDLLWGAT